jgi:hypothetical protein
MKLSPSSQRKAACSRRQYLRSPSASVFFAARLTTLGVLNRLDRMEP